MIDAPAAFRRLCVETDLKLRRFWTLAQPPSGGCVLKLSLTNVEPLIGHPAAFRRLCVETPSWHNRG